MLTRGSSRFLRRPRVADHATYRFCSAKLAPLLAGGGIKKLRKPSRQPAVPTICPLEAPVITDTHLRPSLQESLAWKGGCASPGLVPRSVRRPRGPVLFGRHA